MPLGGPSPSPSPEGTRGGVLCLVHCYQASWQPRAGRVLRGVHGGSPLPAADSSLHPPARAALEVHGRLAAHQKRTATANKWCPAFWLTLILATPAASCHLQLFITIQNLRSHPPYVNQPLSITDLHHPQTSFNHQAIYSIFTTENFTCNL